MRILPPWKVFSLIAIAIGAASQVAHAAVSVSYYTVGYFTESVFTGTISNVSNLPNPQPSNTNGYDPNNYSQITVGTDSLTYYFSGTRNVTAVPAPPTNASFGVFDLVGTSNTNFSLANYGFDIEIHQTSPDTGADLLLGTLQGSLIIDSNDIASNTVKLKFTNTTLVLPPLDPSVVYNLLDTTSIKRDLTPITTITPLKGSIAAIPDADTPVAPLPAVAGMGFMMLGLFGAGFVTRKLTRPPLAN